MVLTCRYCGQEFLSPSECKRHQQTHLQTHLDKWSSNTKPDKLSWKPPEAINTVTQRLRCNIPVPINRLSITFQTFKQRLPYRYVHRVGRWEGTTDICRLPRPIFTHLYRWQ